MLLAKAFIIFGPLFDDKGMSMYSQNFSYFIQIFYYQMKNDNLIKLFSFVVSAVSLSLSYWYPGSGVVLDCIDS